MMKTVKQWVVILACLSILPGCGINTAPGHGEKIGQIVKVRKVGILYPTWEAELIRGGMSGGSGSFGVTPFDFTIEDDAMAARCTDAMRKQTEVLITYRTEGVYSCCRNRKSWRIPNQHQAECREVKGAQCWFV